MENIAREVGMTVSGFHHHFNAVTVRSYFQNQKRLRLLEARRLILVKALMQQVLGIVSDTQCGTFQSGLSKHLQLTPMRDVERLRGNTEAIGGQAID